MKKILLFALLQIAVGTTQRTPITAKLVKDFYNLNIGCSSSFENLDLCTTLQVVDQRLECTTYNCYLGSPSVISCSARMGCGDAFCDDGSDSTHNDTCTSGSTTCGGTDCTSQAHCTVSAATCSTQPDINDKLQCTTATAGYYIAGNQVVTACNNSITNAATVTCDADGGNVVVATCDDGYTLSAAAGDGTQTCDGVAFEVSSARYVRNFPVDSPVVSPQGIAFNNDGTKMYVTSGHAVNEYSLPIAFDVSSANYDQNFSVEGASLQGIAFNNDGTKMYVTSGHEVKEYGLSTAFDVSSASHVENLLTLDEPQGILDEPQGIAFNNDGTKMYVTSGHVVNEYSLSTAFKVSSANYVRNFSVEGASLQGIAFNNDGTKMYVTIFEELSDSTLVASTSTGSTAYVATVKEYRLLNAFDVSYASHVENFPVGSHSPQGIAFNNDGTKMYVTSELSAHVYSLSTPFDVSTSAWRPAFSLAFGPQGIAFNNDGTKMYVTSGHEVKEYGLSTAFELWSARYVRNFPVEGASPQGIAFNNDGTKMYVTSGHAVNEYSLSTPFEVSSASYVQNFSVEGSVEGDSLQGIAFNNDGTKMYVTSGIEVQEYSLSTAFKVSSANYVHNVWVHGAMFWGWGRVHGIAFNNDGTKMYVTIFEEMGGGNVNEYDLSTAFDVSSASYVSNHQTLDEPQGIAFNNDGTKIYVISGSSAQVKLLSTPFDLQTADQWPATFSLAFSPQGIAFNNDGTKMYVTIEHVVNEYGLSTAFDVSSASYVQNLKVDGFGLDSSVPQGIAFNDDGTKMYVTMFDGLLAYVIEYDLFFPFDVYDARQHMIHFFHGMTTGIAFNDDGTKMYVINEHVVNEFQLLGPFDVAGHPPPISDFTVGSQEAGPQGIAFNNDGTKMYVIIGHAVNEYSLSTAFEVSSANYVRNFSVEGASLQGIAFNNDGTKMYVTSGHVVNEYSL